MNFVIICFIFFLQYKQRCEEGSCLHKRWNFFSFSSSKKSQVFFNFIFFYLHSNIFISRGVKSLIRRFDLIRGTVWSKTDQDHGFSKNRDHVLISHFYDQNLIKKHFFYKNPKNRKIRIQLKFKRNRSFHWFWWMNRAQERKKKNIWSVFLLLLILIFSEQGSVQEVREPGTSRNIPRCQCNGKTVSSMCSQRRLRFRCCCCCCCCCPRCCVDDVVVWGPYFVVLLKRGLKKGETLRKLVLIDIKGMIKNDQIHDQNMIKDQGFCYFWKSTWSKHDQRSRFEHVSKKGHERDLIIEKCDQESLTPVLFLQIRFYSKKRASKRVDKCGRLISTT